MQRLDKQEMELLIEQRGKYPSVSIYMPTLSGREGSAENPIRFKNLIKQAENDLEAQGFKPSERQELLAPASKLIDDSFFWGRQSKGLALFLSDGFYRYYRLPIEFEERVVVKNSFYLKPLFSLLAADQQFYVLALSQKDARLLRGTRGFVEEMDLSEVIRKFEEKFGGELPEKYLQFHTGAQPSGGMRAAIYYGHGGALDNVEREKLRKYFRFIDQELRQIIDEKNVPLVLACVEELAPLYKEASNHPYLLEEGIRGNPDNMKAHEIHRAAMEIMEPVFKEKLEEVKNRYHDLLGTGKASNNLREIVPASFHGRVSELLVDTSRQEWGWYNQETGQLEWQQESLAENEELLDLASTETYINRGEVFALKPEEMPDAEPLVAIFRW